MYSELERAPQSISSYPYCRINRRSRSWAMKSLYGLCDAHITLMQATSFAPMVNCILPCLRFLTRCLMTRVCRLMDGSEATLSPSYERSALIQGLSFGIIGEAPDFWAKLLWLRYGIVYVLYRTHGAPKRMCAVKSFIIIFFGFDALSFLVPIFIMRRWLLRRSPSAI